MVPWWEWLVGKTLLYSLEFTETEWRDRGCFSEILQVASEQFWLFLGGLVTWNGNDERKKKKREREKVGEN